MAIVRIGKTEVILADNLSPICEKRKEEVMETQVCKLPSHSGAVYLSGPIVGQTYQQARFGWRKQVADSLSPGIKALSPMRHEGHLAEIKNTIEANTYPDHFFSGAKVIVEKDRLDIEKCDIMLVNLLGAKKVSIGTMVEIGIAMTLGKKIVLVIEPSGTVPVGISADGMKVVYGNNIHDHPFVTVPASLRLDNLDDAVYAINSLLSEGL